MGNPSSDSYRNALRHMGQDYSFAPRYLRPRDPFAPTNASSDIKPKENQGYYPTGSFWTNTTNGNLWALQKISNNLANWILLASGSVGPLLAVGVDASTAPGTNPVVPTTSGLLTIIGNQTDPGTIPTVVRTDSLAANRFTIEIQQTSTAAAKNVALNGVSHFNSTQFTNDQGFISLASGGTSIQDVNLDYGTTPIVPTAGAISLLGATVLAGTHPVRTHGTGVSTGVVEVQLSQAIASTDATKVGLASFNSAQFIVDANGFVSSTGGSLVQGWSNLGITYSASTFSITAADGSALSATNPAYVVLQSNANPGRNIKVAVTANQTFIDDTGASTIVGNLFGYGVADVAASNDVPFFIYSVLNDAENAISFMISRTPGMALSPIAANIGKTGSALADVSFGFFALSNPTVIDYDTNSCLTIGSFRMRLTTAGGDWTVQAFAKTDGIGNYQANILFTFPVNVMGASASTHWQPHGGTACVFTTQDYHYSLDITGRVNIYYGGLTPVLVDGAGAVNARLSCPFSINQLILNGNIGGTGRLGTTGNVNVVLTSFPVNGYSEFAYADVSAALAQTLLNQDITNSGTNGVQVQISYNIQTA